MSDVSRLGVPLAIGLGWTVERPLAGGEFGALLVERRGVHAVFKVMPKDAKSEWLEEALFVASQLLETGYPLPRYFDAGTRDGHGYTVQEHVEGIPARRLTLSLVDQLVELNDAQASLRYRTRLRPNRDGWDEVVASLTPMRADGHKLAVGQWKPAALLLAEARAAAAEHAGTLLQSDQASHQDFHHGNVLAQDDRVIAIIDWDEARWADAAFDLFVMWFWASVGSISAEEGTASTVPALARLRAAIDCRLSTSAQARYSAYLTALYLDFFARERPVEVPAFTQWSLALLAPHWRDNSD